MCIRDSHKLYEYHITDNHLEDDHFIIEGEHRKCEEISDCLLYTSDMILSCQASR